MMPMKIQSLGYATSLAVISYTGKITEHSDYWVAQSTGNPDYHWGNLLLMKKAPVEGDFDAWNALFEREFMHQPLVKHRTFGWDTVDGAMGNTTKFVEAGFVPELSTVLAADREWIRATKSANAECTVRALASDGDWSQALENQIACREAAFDEEDYRRFKVAQMREYRSICESGKGSWFGAFLGDRLAADLGIIFCWDGLARYQQVGTHPEFRRRGLCEALVAKSAALCPAEMKRFVMVADPGYHAIKVYEKAGFREEEKQVGLCRPPKK
jgi:ribosomal protein S18 acetylase RimI-like enzyme